MRIIFKRLGIIASVIVLLIFFVFFVPIIINECYNKGGYVTNWGAADVLIYYGAVLGGMATLLAIYLTIRYESKKNRLERKREKIEQRIRYIGSILFGALRHFSDEAYLHNLTVHPKLILDSPQKIYDFYHNAHKYENIEIYFTSDEKNFLETVLKDIQEYAKEYSEILWKLNLLLRDYSLNVHFSSLIKDNINNSNNLIHIKDISLASLTELSEKEMIIVNKWSDIFEEIKELSEKKYEKLDLSVQTDLKRLEDKWLNEDLVI